MEKRRAPAHTPPRSPFVPTDITNDRSRASAPELDTTPLPDIVCLSHLRWDFVFQRPQHLLTRFARESRVFYVEEPEHQDGPPRVSVTLRENGVNVVVPTLPRGLSADEEAALQKELLDDLLRRHGVRRFVLWYYTPMALAYSRHLEPVSIVYDCMDELAAFAGAPKSLREREAELLIRADVVLTGGQSLYESKRELHPNVHVFPSSVDTCHFARARHAMPDPADQKPIGRPRIGFFGVIDERMDMDLVHGVARARPDWQLIFLGPICKIDPASFPALPNVHHLGRKTYDELPAYIRGWDVAILPFARNESTRYISPTKTPEYLAAGKPVVSTSIRDVVRPYGELKLARIADSVRDFVAAIEASRNEDASERLRRADRFLSTMSWEQTFAGVRDRIVEAMESRDSETESGTLAG